MISKKKKEKTLHSSRSDPQLRVHSKSPEHSPHNSSLNKNEDLTESVGQGAAGLGPLGPRGNRSGMNL